MFVIARTSRPSKFGIKANHSARDFGRANYFWKAAGSTFTFGVSATLKEEAADAPGRAIDSVIPASKRGFLRSSE